MNRLLLAGMIGLISVVSANAQFDQYFWEKTMRFDFYHCGDQNTQSYFFDELKEEPYWAGSKVSLIDDNGYWKSTV